MKKEIIIAKDKKHLKELIKDCIEREGCQCDLNHIDTSPVTNMAYLFHQSDFNGYISGWNVSNVTIMNGMFAYSEFNGDLYNWNVSNVKDMCSMFSFSKFNGNISTWNVSNVINMDSMFYDSKFNGNISEWNVSRVIDMRLMFYNSEFNEDISSWNIINAKYINDIFTYCKTKNLPYWVKIVNFEDRRMAVESYRHKKILDKLISPEKAAHIIPKI